MNDQELLTYAAKAAGFEYDSELGTKYGDGIVEGEWNPLNSSSDAFILMIDAGIDVECHGAKSNFKFVCAMAKNGEIQIELTDDNFACIFSQTRRAIVMAAAEIGKGM